MSLLSSQYAGTNNAHKTFLVIFKVHGNAIHFWTNDRTQPVSTSKSFTVSCHNVETDLDQPNSDIKQLTLSEPAILLDKCSFQDQSPAGMLIGPTDLAIFMTSPMDSSKRASYAIRVALANKLEPSSADGSRIGTAYLYLEPYFSSQGIQKIPIITADNRTAIGQIQVEYLIVTNPVAFGLDPPRPDWLYKVNGLEAGHRGCGSGRRLDLPEQLLENTIASFNYAYKHGADLCELDVFMSADGVPVVYHDFDVDAVTAQQSSDQLGKFRVQVNEFTVEQLRDFRLLSLKDSEGSPYTLKVANQARDNRPFPTLAEVLDQVDEDCGMNIEIKWPQQLENGKMEARKYREINDFADRIIKVIEAHSRNRRIIIESFDPDLVILLRLKQNKFPTFFLSQGLTKRYTSFMDIRSRLVENGAYFAQAFGIAGMDIILEYYMKSGKQLVQFLRNHDVIPRTWGDIGDNSDTLKTLRSLGLQCITYDKIDIVRGARK